MVSASYLRTKYVGRYYECNCDTEKCPFNADDDKTDRGRGESKIYSTGKKMKKENGKSFERYKRR